MLHDATYKTFGMFGVVRVAKWGFGSNFKTTSPTSRTFCTFRHPRVAKLGFGVVYVSYVFYVLYVENVCSRVLPKIVAPETKE